MKDIPVGILRPATMRQIGEGINAPRRAIVVFSDGTSEPYIVKQVGALGLAAECLAALIGHKLNMPVVLPAIARHPQDDGLWFASRDAAMPSLKRYLKIGQAMTQPQRMALARILYHWDGIGDAISFDEAIQNRDRNPGNLLYGGRKIVLIDHERAFGIQGGGGNHLADYATAQFASELETKIRAAARSAALVHMTTLDPAMDGNIWPILQAAFLTLPPEARDHYETLANIVIQRRARLHLHVEQAVKPMTLFPDHEP